MKEIEEIARLVACAFQTDCLASDVDIGAHTARCNQLTAAIEAQMVSLTEDAARECKESAKIAYATMEKMVALRAEIRRLREAMLDAADDCACEKPRDAEETLRTALASNAGEGG